jgi:signal transduction histidine kinase
MRVILIEGNPRMSEHLSKICAQTSSPALEIHNTDNLQQGLEWCSQDKGDVVVVDTALIDPLSQNMLRDFLHYGKAVPIVFIGHDEDNGLSAYLSGGYDYMAIEDVDEHVLRKSITQAYLMGLLERRLDDDSRDILKQIRDHIWEQKIRDQRKDDYFAHVAGNLKEPLGELKNKLTMLQENRGWLSGHKKENWEGMFQEVKKLQKIIGALTDYSDMEMRSIILSKSYTDICELIRETMSGLQPLFDQKKLQVLTLFGKESHLMFLDRQRIKQVMHQLLHNAWKYCQVAGQIDISVIHQEGRGGTEVIVADNGVGIAKEDMENIFEPFGLVFQKGRSDQQGPGLGLAISKEIIHAHGGSLRVESARGQGCRMIVHLPHLSDKDILSECVQQYISHAQKERGTLALVMVEIDGLDQALKVYSDVERAIVYRDMTQEIRQCARRSRDLILKYGDRTLAILLYNTERRYVLHLLRQMKKILGKFLDNFRRSHPGTFTLQFHLAIFPEDSRSVKELIEKAHQVTVNV